MRILFAISDQRQRVDPGGTPIFFILVQQHLQSSDVVTRKQGGRQQIADALIVVGIEDQHRTIVIDRGLLLAQAPQRDRKPCSRPHIGPGLEKPPEVTGQLLELVAERAFACLHTLTVQRQRVLLGARFFLREQNIGIRA